MDIQSKPYFYDSQVKRYILQIMAAFGGYQVQSGIQRDGKTRFIHVPIMFGGYDRMVGYMRNKANPNVTPSLPIMSLEIKGLKQADDLRRAPEMTSQYRMDQRAPATMEGVLGTRSRGTIVAERPMPVPYIMTVNLNIWSSNQDQMLQIVEQIASQYNPQLDLKLSDSPADWTWLSYLKFEGSVNFKRAALDIGGGTGTDPLHLAELDFETLVHLSAPTKVYNANYVKKIKTNFRKMEQTLDVNEMEYLDGFILNVDEELTQEPEE